ncbi:hypothetical protein L1987_67399 [Smallanthus sonchifolius]|uniref:Uncharacterized protein n=1 Tax=Smallanthus sonchifolius TaxID=185202 RepID=A0ACB9B326_9ASTR|nr:hypothetical protein L1987_67399 [Smallanthus sonchifolius]
MPLEKLAILMLVVVTTSSLAASRPGTEETKKNTKEEEERLAKMLELTRTASPPSDTVAPSPGGPISCTAACMDICMVLEPLSDRVCEIGCEINTDICKYNLQSKPDMVFNTVLVASVATVSADIWQSISCFSERISSEELLDLVICFPLQQLGQFALCLWNFFCLPLSPADSYYLSYTYDDADDSDSDSYLSSAAGCYSGYDPYSDDHSD